MIQHERGWLPWRLGTLLVGSIVVFSPLLMLLLELLQAPSAWTVWREWDRLLELLGNTLTIAAGSSLLAIVIGGITAILITRTSLAGRVLWALLHSVSLFIPLPMLMSGWYLIAQEFGAPLPALWPLEARWLGTMLMHGLMGVPWVVLLLSLGLLSVPPELEEEMLLYAAFPQVLRRIILPRCWPFVMMSILLVSWPTWHEITVTDFFKVRTIAEEVYLQLNDGSVEEGPRALAAAFPWCLLMVLLAAWAMRYWRQHCPPSWPSHAQQRRYTLGWMQFPAQLWMLLILTLLVVIPLAGIVHRAGMDYQAGGIWSLPLAATRVWQVITRQSTILNQSLSLSLITGLLASGSALLLVWLARGSRWLESLFWWLAALLWSIPGPLLGLGLLTFIQLLIYLPGLSSWLYSEPSPVPNIWSAWLRFLPLAWLALWPLARLIPTLSEEAAWLEGATPWQRFWLLYWPRLWKPAAGIALAVALLTLGEISASKLVTTPGFLPLSHHLFQQLHAGADTEVAALSIVLCLPALLVALILGVIYLLQFRKRH